MERIVYRPGALDVHKASVTARQDLARITSDRARAEYKPTVQGLLALGDWLEAAEVETGGDGGHRRVLEAGLALLEDRFELMLVNARHVKQVPGRKTDVQMPSGSASCWRPGCSTASFVPPKPIRTLRNLTRYRKTQIRERSARPTAAQDARGHRDQARLRRDGHPRQVRPRDARRAGAGTTDPTVLADLAQGQLRKKLPALARRSRAASTPSSADRRQILAHIDYLDEPIDRLSDEIEERIAPFRPAA